MTNLERYQSMSAEEFASEFWEDLCDKVVARDFDTCETSEYFPKCLVDYLNAEYKGEDDG